MSTYNLEMEAVIEHVSTSEGVNSYTDHSLFFDVMVDAKNISEAREKGKALINKYYPKATYVCFTHVDPSC